jgi:hypothetical protein
MGCAVNIHAGISAVLASSMLLALSAPAEAKAAFDGSWNISATTTQGSCDRSVHYQIVIIDGRVMSGDITGVSGRVTPSGSVTVTVRRKDGTAVGSGRLSGDSGAGHWTVKSPSRNCAGEWQAQRAL